jgi:hypothetical protein
MQSLWVTHYFLRRPTSSGWIEVPFITKACAPPRHTNEAVESYFGFETTQPLAAELIRQLLDAKEIRPIDYLYHISQSQRLWLSPQRELWLASADDPLGDARKILVDKLDSAYIPAITWDRAAKTDDLARSVVLHGAIDKCIIEAYPGDYLNSKQYLSGDLDINNPRAYYPRWQQHLTQRVVADARAVADAMHLRHPSLSVLPYQEHDYRNIEETIVARKVALPYEVIFQTPRRMMSLSILPFGSIEYFALIYAPGSMVESDLELRSEEVFRGRYDEWIERIERLQIRVCAPTHTAVDDLLTDAITERSMTRTRKDDENKISKLVRWISVNSFDAVIACDTGIAFQLLAAARKKGGKLKDLRFARVRYDEPLPCGMPYVKQDEVWGGYLKRVISEEFRSPDDEVQTSLQDFRFRFEQMDGVWAPCAEMRV